MPDRVELSDELINGKKIYYLYINDDTNPYISFVNLEEFEPEERDAFNTWLNFQTRPVIKNVKSAAYAWDYRRFANRAYS